MSSLNIDLSDRLKAFAERQARANQLPGASAYIESLLAREELELALMEGIVSGEAILADDAWRDRRRQELIQRHRPQSET